MIHYCYLAALKNFLIIVVNYEKEKLSIIWLYQFLPEILIIFTIKNNPFTNLIIIIIISIN